MTHLKRFKNWLVVVYYACWTYSQQFRRAQDKLDQPDSSVPQANLIASDDSSAEVLQASMDVSPAPVEVAAPPMTAPVEVVEKIDVRDSQPVVEVPIVSAPKVEIKKPANVEPKVSAPQAASAKTQVPAVKAATPQVSAKAKSNGSAARVSEPQPQPSNGKYQPGAINDQTAQRLARLLVSEIKLYYKSKSEGDDSIGDTNIYDILKDPIEKSRKHYVQRMGKTAIESMPDYFHGELVRTLCGGDASRLGPNYPMQG
jgi:hypothetical protein